ncbi:23S rRNA m(2)A-2503 methyltransferase [Longilinea arvoryzae]|uniref:Probable dual-specificity RNA methyltransferase RlmN n=1 Tax=Longilinea arvoryzae TaxID=360412 RepID=A0A0S7BB47_9CHLR|nr:23S rRNA (adenine(2503)-C(2))-methyltransferase RlmN [Longilinea arvoryzae]GAP14855.1 23S rRNA m(2)A-2503 methyltransferase [Longilinea arvoryzae]
METERPLIFDLDLDQLKELVLSWGEPAYRAKQIWQGIYCQLWQTPQEFTPLPASLREKMAAELRFSGLTPAAVLKSSDHQTVKTLFRLADGRSIEAVLMRYEHRQTLCISSQAGCAMGCAFCATGQMGFKRHLSSGEIVEQVMVYARQLKQEGKAVTNVVVMGMGEPFHNYANTLAAIDRLNHPDGFNLGARRFTISTVGLVPMIRQFALERRQINLAISLHASDDELRASMMPVDKRYPIAELMQACREYIDATKRRLTFEWALIQGVNDTPEQARALAHLLKGMLCHVNVIPLNPTHQFSGTGSTRERAEAFRAELEKAGIPCTVRLRRGIDIQAGCGQLATEHAAD